MTTSNRYRSSLWCFFLLAFGLSWLVWVPRALASHGIGELDAIQGLAPFWTHGPALAAVISARFERRGALRELGERLLRWRVGWLWYAVVLAGPLALAFAVAAIHALLGGTWADSLPRGLDEGLVPMAAFFVAIALTDGLGEEAGWRGFALPRLLAGRSALWASLSLGVIWALWHLPLAYTPGAALEGRAVWLLLELPAFSVIYTWVFQHTGGSAFLAILLHASNSLFAVPPDVPRLVVLALISKWLVVVLLVTWLGPAHLARGEDLEALPADASSAGQAP